ncbi:hypothetical protein GCK72_004290 [Caenorhabditis remanei]|uniref:Uncharacterized protein n=1 Tax=Caenorhabditis remanei TaxID=31234 RepID=A0A6A5HD93_CAERE|nr:hypothetical protein GCK72_004290 [Caenorhabditis remanei]KAF1764343.1 hypothetical protein GCK72_004290 [Caenorhabditis remanei]
MKLLIVILLLAVISLASAESEPVEHILQGENLQYPLYNEKAIGFKRQIVEGSMESQFYYLCEKTKGEKKKNCGSWVDEKGNKIASATLKVTFKGIEATFIKLSTKDQGRYYVISEKPKEELGYLRVNVLTPAPLPKQ